MVDPVRNEKHGNGDRNDNDVAESDRAGQKDRDRKIKESEKKIDRESGRDIGAG
jgi:hypothetical protein